MLTSFLKLKKLVSWNWRNFKWRT